jgi:hypothetical protein
MTGLRRALVRASKVAALCAATLGASAVAANAATLTTTVVTATPEQSVPVQLTFAGTTDAGPHDAAIDVVVRPVGGIGCQPTFEADRTAAGDASTTIIDNEDNDEAAGAPYSDSPTWTPPSPGNYMLCAWLEQDGTITGPVTTPITVRGPQVTALAVSFPAAPVNKRSFQIQYTTQTDQQLNLYSVIKPAGGLPCASSFDLETAQNQSETSIFDGDNSPSVFGGPTVTTALDTEGPGNFLICSWIEGPSRGEVDAALTTPFSIAAPPPKPKPFAAGLTITTLTASRTSGIAVTGTTAAALTGALKVTATCERHTVSTSATAGGGAFTAQLPLPNGCPRGAQVTATVKWSGSATVLKGTTSTSTVVAGSAVTHHKHKHKHKRRTHHRRRHHHRHR